MGSVVCWLPAYAKKTTPALRATPPKEGNETGLSRYQLSSTDVKSKVENGVILMDFTLVDQPNWLC